MTDNEDEIALYDSIERAIANVRAALDAIDQAWIRVTAERPNPTPAALAALDIADEMLTVAQEDLARARIALAVYMPRTQSQKQMRRNLCPPPASRSCSPCCYPRGSGL